MNAKQAIPAIAKISPPLLIGMAVFLVLKEIFSGEDSENKSETAPTNAKTENSRKEAEIPVFRPIPAEIPVKLKPHSVPAQNVNPPNSVSSALNIAAIISRAAIPPVSAGPVPKTPAPVVTPAKTTANIPPMNRQFVTREHLAVIFKNGARSLDRKSAVTALQSLGFGKTAAYAALSPDGRFSAWLQCSPDGVITWTK